MKSRDFCYWLQGFFELNNMKPVALTVEQCRLIQQHLNLVFHHEIDPSMGDQKHQEELNAIHTPSPPMEAAAKPNYFTGPVPDFSMSSKPETPIVPKLDVLVRC